MFDFLDPGLNLQIVLAFINLQNRIIRSVALLAFSISKIIQYYNLWPSDYPLFGFAWDTF